MQISKKATFVFPRKALRNGYDPKTSIGAQLKKTSSTTARRKLATEETNDQQIFSLLKHTEHLKANDSIMYPDFEQVISLSLLMSNNQCKRCEVLVQGKLGFPDQFPGEDGFINTYTQRLYQELMGKETLCFQEPAPLIRSHFNPR